MFTNCLVRWFFLNLFDIHQMTNSGLHRGSARLWPDSQHHNKKPWTGPGWSSILIFQKNILPTFQPGEEEKGLLGKLLDKLRSLLRKKQVVAAKKEEEEGSNNEEDKIVEDDEGAKEQEAPCDKQREEESKKEK